MSSNNFADCDDKCGSASRRNQDRLVQRIADDRALAPNEQHHLRKDAKFARPRLFAVFRLTTNSKRDRRIWKMLLFLVQFRFGQTRQVAYYHPSFPA